MIARKPGSLTSGDSDAVLVVGPIEPATKRSGPAALRAISAALTLISSVCSPSPHSSSFRREPWKVSGFQVNVLSREELAGRTFEFMSEPPGVQAVIAAAVIFPLFTLMTFWVALFRPGLKPRWLWLIAIVLGVGTIYADTASDALSFLPISVQLFGAGATWSGSAFDGWVFSASTPFGAAAFWLFAPRAAKPDQ